MNKEEKRSIVEKINNYAWYHRIKVAEDLYTDPGNGGYPWLWDFILRSMGDIDFKGKRVLDAGCRDGFFSFEIEKRGGAEEIIGIDSELSKGSTEFLIPFFNSKVKMYELNIYDLTPEKFGLFDVILLFGVVYHLRYPFWGLKKVTECLQDKGILLIESGMLFDRGLNNKPFLYCPVEDSPYGGTDCSFFNMKGLAATLRYFNCRLLDFKTLPYPIEIAGRVLQKIRTHGKFPVTFFKTRDIRRQFFVFQKDASLPQDAGLRTYWGDETIA